MNEIMKRKVDEIMENEKDLTTFIIAMTDVFEMESQLVKDTLHYIRDRLCAKKLLTDLNNLECQKKEKQIST